MSLQPNEFPHDKLPSGGDENVVNERVLELTWALLDESATDEDMALLDNLLLSDASARKLYVECIQLHTELMGHFAEERQKSGQKTPVLGFLGLQMPAGFPTADELK